MPTPHAIQKQARKDNAAAVVARNPLGISPMPAKPEPNAILADTKPPDPVVEAINRRNRIAAHIEASTAHQRYILVGGKSEFQVAEQVRRHAKAWCNHLGLDYHAVFWSMTPAEFLPRGWRQRARTAVYAALREQGYTEQDVRAAFTMPDARAKTA